MRPSEPWWKKLFRPRPRLFPDRFATTGSEARDQMAAAVRLTLAAGERVIVVCQFPDEFFLMEQTLQQLALPLQVGEPPVTAESALPDVVCLTLADALQPQSGDQVRRPPVAGSARRSPVNVMVFQRHPWAASDDRMVAAVRSWTVTARLGFFVSLDHPLLQPALTPTVRALMDQLGLEQDVQIASSLLGKRLRALSLRLVRPAGPVKPAHSAREWLDSNCPGWNGRPPH